MPLSLLHQWNGSSQILLVPYLLWWKNFQLKNYLDLVFHFDIFVFIACIPLPQIIASLFMWIRYPTCCSALYSLKSWWWVSRTVSETKFTSVSHLSFWICRINHSSWWYAHCNRCYRSSSETDPMSDILSPSDTGPVSSNIEKDHY